MSNNILKQKIKEITNFIKEKTGDEINFKVKKIECQTQLGFADDEWNNKSELPPILHQDCVKLTENVHILHELIHIQNFFIDGYKIIVSDEQNDVEGLFKDVPENFLAHRIIYGFGLVPIDENWFNDNNKIDFNKSDLKTAVQLVNFYDFLKFAPKEKKNILSNQFNILLKQAEPKPSSIIANKVINIFKNIDYKDVDSYNKYLPEIINNFAPEYSSFIRPSKIIKEQGIWKYS